MSDICRVTIEIFEDGQPTITSYDRAGSVQKKPIEIEGLVKVFKDHSHHKMEMIPPRLIATDYEQTVVYWRPPQIQLVGFRLAANKKEYKFVDIPLPGLIAMYEPKGSRMMLVAFKGRVPPQMDSPLYKAPLSNITSDQGGVCMGTTEMTQQGKAITIDPDLMWSEFFASAFTGHQAGKRIKSHPDDVRPFLMDLEGETKFPEEELLPLDLDLRDWLERYG